MSERIGVSDDEWALIGPLLPPEHGRGCRPAGDNRRYFEGMMWMARSGAQRRRLPDDYGKWNSVFRRYPALCQHAVANTRTAFDKPYDETCDETCDDRVLTEAFALMTRALMSTVERLRTAGAEVLLVDLTRNGGGTEWAEAAARIISPVPLRSAPIRVIRGEAWATRWRALATKLRHAASEAGAVDRTMLLDLARSADGTADELKPCNGDPCSRMVQVGFASGLMPELPSGRLDGRPWDRTCSAQHSFRTAIMSGKARSSCWSIVRHGQPLSNLRHFCRITTRRS